MNKKLFLAAPLALAAGAILATPASAATTWHNAGQLRAEIAQLDRQIDRTRGLSSREEQRLERQVDQVQALYRAYARNGFSRGEINILNSRVDRIRTQLFQQSHDWNNRNDRRHR